MQKIIYDTIRYLELPSSFVIISAFENYLKTNAFNGYIIFNNQDIVHIIGGEIFNIRRLEDIKRPWIANVYELNPKTLILFMYFKNSKQIESLKISKRALDAILKNILETTPYFWLEIKSRENIHDLIYFSSEIVGIYKNGYRIDEIFKDELDEKIEVNAWDFKELFESKRTEMIKILYLKRFENVWQKYKEIIIREFGKDKADVEFRKIQKELSKKHSILDPLLGIVDIDKDLNLKIQSVNESELEAITKLLLEFYKKALPKYQDRIRKEIS